MGDAHTTLPRDWVVLLRPGVHSCPTVMHSAGAPWGRDRMPQVLDGVNVASVRMTQALRT
jgi:hypothetical protein